MNSIKEKAKTNTHSGLSTWLPMALIFAGTALGPVEAAPDKDIKVSITLDESHTDLSGVETGVGLNGVRGDLHVNGDPEAYVDKVDGVRAFVGRNSTVTFELNNGARSMNIDLGGAVGCSASVAVDTDGQEGCDPCTDSVPAQNVVTTDTRFLLLGKDIDDLSLYSDVGDAITGLRLLFNVDGANWVLHMGPNKHPSYAGTVSFDPESDPVMIRRIDADTWRFQSTGAHLAALHKDRDTATDLHVYHGQYSLPISGIITAKTAQPNPAAGYSDLELIEGGLACCCNGPADPVVSIISPADGASFADTEGDIVFSGTATDAEDGNLDSVINWFLDDALTEFGVGPTATLSAGSLGLGTHTIIAQATDSDSQTSEDTITISITDGSTPACDVVATATYSSRGKHLDITITVEDNVAGGAVGGASVSIDLYRDGIPDKSFSGTTGSEGFVTFRRSKAPSGAYSIGDIGIGDDCVVSLVDSGFVK